MQLPFQIAVNRAFRNLPGQPARYVLPEVAVVHDERLPIQVMQALHIVQRRARREPGCIRQRIVGRDLGKVQNFARAAPVVARGGLRKGFDRTQGERRLPGRLEDVAHALALHGLHIALAHQLTDRAAQRVAGAVQLGDQHVFAGQQFLRRVFAGLYLPFQDLVKLFVFCLWHVGTSLLYRRGGPASLAPGRD